MDLEYLIAVFLRLVHHLLKKLRLVISTSPETQGTPLKGKETSKIKQNHTEPKNFHIFPHLSLFHAIQVLLFSKNTLSAGCRGMPTQDSANGYLPLLLFYLHCTAQNTATLDTTLAIGSALMVMLWAAGDTDVQTFDKFAISKSQKLSTVFLFLCTEMCLSVKLSHNCKTQGMLHSECCTTKDYLLQGSP